MHKQHNITVERTFIDPPELQRLEGAVEETAARVADHKRTVADIETQANVANLALANAKRAREVHALKAATGDAHAVAQIKYARSEQHEAEQILGDLKIAHPEALAHLAEAEKVAAAARHELALHNAMGLKRQRVAAAARIDAGFAACAEAFAEYERLGRELQNFPDLNFGSSVSGWENVLGFKRIFGSLPSFITKLFPTSISQESSQRAPLAVSEAHFWQLPLVETDKSKAA
jgi:hypothetical protein